MSYTSKLAGEILKRPNDNRTLKLIITLGKMRLFYALAEI